MERSVSAKSAVVLIGKLAEEGGFYGPSAHHSDAGEALFISDPTEVWLFHVLPAPNNSAV